MMKAIPLNWVKRLVAANSLACPAGLPFRLILQVTVQRHEKQRPRETKRQATGVEDFARWDYKKQDDQSKETTGMIKPPMTVKPSSIFPRFR